MHLQSVNQIGPLKRANPTKIMQKVIDQYRTFCYNNGMLCSRATFFNL